MSLPVVAPPPTPQCLLCDGWVKKHTPEARRLLAVGLVQLLAVGTVLWLVSECALPATVASAPVGSCTGCLCDFDEITEFIAR